MYLNKQWGKRLLTYYQNEYMIEQIKYMCRQRLLEKFKGAIRMNYRFDGLELLDQSGNIVACVGMPVEKMPEEIRGMARVDVTFLDFHGKLIIGTKNAFVQSLRLLIYKKTYVLEALAKATVQDCDAVFEDAFYSVRTALDTWFKDAIKPIAGDRESVYKIGNKKICAGIYPDCIYINVAYSKVVIILEPRCEFRGEFDRYNGIVGHEK